MLEIWWTYLHSRSDLFAINHHVLVQCHCPNYWNSTGTQHSIHTYSTSSCDLELVQHRIIVLYSWKDRSLFHKYSKVEYTAESLGHSLISSQFRTAGRHGTEIRYWVSLTRSVSLICQCSLDGNWAREMIVLSFIYAAICKVLVQYEYMN